MKQPKIIVNNHKSRLIWGRDKVYEIREATKIKSKGYFYSPAYRRGQWDGYVKYISEETGLFSTGLIPFFTEHIQKNYGIAPIFEDARSPFKMKEDIKELGEFSLRTYQKRSKDAINNKFMGITFQRGILAEATNAGKNLIAASIAASFHSKRKSLFLINNQEIFTQAVEEIGELLGKENVGYISSKKTKLGNFTICMVQTLGNRAKSKMDIRNWLQDIDIIFVDEADDVIGRKDAKGILSLCCNATVRIALTGTALMNPDKNKNMELLSYFGPVLNQTTNKELVEGGYSAKPIITILDGNMEVSMKGDYAYEYEHGITRNKKRHKRIWKRVQWHIDKKHVPIVVLFKYHKHGSKLLKSVPKEISEQFRIGLIHGESKSRAAIINDFKLGKIDILISSMIIRRGKNLPSIRALLNAAGGDMESNILQLLGRSLRKMKGKNKVYFDDFHDKGKYLLRHSNHRVRWLMNQGFPVKKKHTKNMLK